MRRSIATLASLAPAGWNSPLIATYVVDPDGLKLVGKLDQIDQVQPYRN